MRCWLQRAMANERQEFEVARRRWQERRPTASPAVRPELDPEFRVEIRKWLATAPIPSPSVQAELDAEFIADAQRCVIEGMRQIEIERENQLRVTIAEFAALIDRQPQTLYNLKAVRALGKSIPGKPKRYAYHDLIIATRRTDAPSADEARQRLAQR